MDSRLVQRLRRFADAASPKWQIVLEAHPDTNRDLIITRRDLIEILGMAEMSQYATLPRPGTDLREGTLDG